MKHKLINKKYFLAVLLISAGLFAGVAAQAFCPVCTLAVAGGVGLSRWLGVDDTITGLWIGGFLVSMVIWTLDWLAKKKINFVAKKSVTAAVWYLMVVAPLWLSDIIGHPMNRIWGVDKLVVGIFFGSVFFLAGGGLHFYLKKRNGDKVYFPYQKVVFAIGPLIILSAVFYFITR
jgi:hypothetical protein